MIYLNGHFVKSEQALIHVSDRGLLLGDGVFETLRVTKGRIQNLQAHWDRLSDSLSLLAICLPLQCHEFEHILDELLIKNELIALDAAVRITVTRGEGQRGILPSTLSHPNYFITTHPCPKSSTKPFKVIISRIRRNEFSPTAFIKSTNYLDNILARMEATHFEADDALFLNTKGHLTEATASNLFVVSNGEVLTPQIADGLLPGSMRAIVLSICRALELPTQECSILPPMLLEAEEVFLTNSLICIQPVAVVEDYFRSDKQNWSTKIREYYLQHYENELS